MKKVRLLKLWRGEVGMATPTKSLEEIRGFFMFIVYILHSSSCNKFYTGHTHDLENRLTEHNLGETKSIKNCSPWKIAWQTEVETRAEAMKIENKIKKRGAGRFLHDLKKSFLNN